MRLHVEMNTVHQHMMQQHAARVWQHSQGNNETLFYSLSVSFDPGSGWVESGSSFESWVKAPQKRKGLALGSMTQFGSVLVGLRAFCSSCQVLPTRWSLGTK